MLRACITSKVRQGRGFFYWYATDRILRFDIEMLYRIYISEVAEIYTRRVFAGITHLILNYRAKLNPIILRVWRQVHRQNLPKSFVIRDFGGLLSYILYARDYKSRFLLLSSP